MLEQRSIQSRVIKLEKWREIEGAQRKQRIKQIYGRPSDLTNNKLAYFQELNSHIKSVSLNPSISRRRLASDNSDAINENSKLISKKVIKQLKKNMQNSNEQNLDNAKAQQHDQYNISYSSNPPQQNINNDDRQLMQNMKSSTLQPIFQHNQTMPSSLAYNKISLEQGQTCNYIPPNSQFHTPINRRDHDCLLQEYLQNTKLIQQREYHLTTHANNQSISPAAARQRNDSVLTNKKKKNKKKIKSKLLSRFYSPNIQIGEYKANNKQNITQINDDEDNHNDNSNDYSRTTQLVEQYAAATNSTLINNQNQSKSNLNQSNLKNISKFEGFDVQLSQNHLHKRKFDHTLDHYQLKKDSPKQQLDKLQLSSIDINKIKNYQEKQNNEKEKQNIDKEKINIDKEKQLSQVCSLPQVNQNESLVQNIQNNTEIMEFKANVDRTLPNQFGYMYGLQNQNLSSNKKLKTKKKMRYNMNSSMIERSRSPDLSILMNKMLKQSLNKSIADDGIMYVQYSKSPQKNHRKEGYIDLSQSQQMKSFTRDNSRNQRESEENDLKSYNSSKSQLILNEGKYINCNTSNDRINEILQQKYTHDIPKNLLLPLRKSQANQRVKTEFIDENQYLELQQQQARDYSSSLLQDYSQYQQQRKALLIRQKIPSSATKQPHYTPIKSRSPILPRVGQKQNQQYNPIMMNNSIAINNPIIMNNKNSTHQMKYQYIVESDPKFQIKVMPKNRCQSTQQELVYMSPSKISNQESNTPLIYSQLQYSQSMLNNDSINKRSTNQSTINKNSNNNSNFKSYKNSNVNRQIQEQINGGDLNSQNIISSSEHQEYLKNQINNNMKSSNSLQQDDNVVIEKENSPLKSRKNSHQTNEAHNHQVPKHQQNKTNQNTQRSNKSDKNNQQIPKRISSKPPTIINQSDQAKSDSLSSKNILSSDHIDYSSTISKPPLRKQSSNINNNQPQVHIQEQQIQLNAISLDKNKQSTNNISNSNQKIEISSSTSTKNEMQKQQNSQIEKQESQNQVKQEQTKKDQVKQEQTIKDQVKQEQTVENQVKQEQKVENQVKQEQTIKDQVKQDQTVENQVKQEQKIQNQEQKTIKKESPLKVQESKAQENEKQTKQQQQEEKQEVIKEKMKEKKLPQINDMYQYQLNINYTEKDIEEIQNRLIQFTTKKRGLCCLEPFFTKGEHEVWVDNFQIRIDSSFQNQMLFKMRLGNTEEAKIYLKYEDSEITNEWTFVKQKESLKCLPLKQSEGIVLSGKNKKSSLKCYFSLIYLQTLHTTSDLHYQLNYSQEFMKIIKCLCINNYFTNYLEKSVNNPCIQMNNFAVFFPSQNTLAYENEVYVDIEELNRISKRSGQQYSQTQLSTLLHDMLQNISLLHSKYITINNININNIVYSTECHTFKLLSYVHSQLHQDSLTARQQLLTHLEEKQYQSAIYYSRDEQFNQYQQDIYALGICAIIFKYQLTDYTLNLATIQEKIAFTQSNSHLPNNQLILQLIHQSEFINRSSQIAQTLLQKYFSNQSTNLNQSNHIAQLNNLNQSNHITQQNSQIQSSVINQSNNYIQQSNINNQIYLNQQSHSQNEQINQNKQMPLIEENSQSKKISRQSSMNKEQNSNERNTGQIYNKNRTISLGRKQVVNIFEGLNLQDGIDSKVQNASSNTQIQELQVLKKCFEHCGKINQFFSSYQSILDTQRQTYGLSSSLYLESLIDFYFEALNHNQKERVTSILDYIEKENLFVFISQVQKNQQALRFIIVSAFKFLQENNIEKAMKYLDRALAFPNLTLQDLFQLNLNQGILASQQQKKQKALIYLKQSQLIVKSIQRSSINLAAPYLLSGKTQFIIFNLSFMPTQIFQILID